MAKLGVQDQLAGPRHRHVRDPRRDLFVLLIVGQALAVEEHVHLRGRPLARLHYEDWSLLLVHGHSERPDPRRRARCNRDSEAITTVSPAATFALIDDVLALSALPVDRLLHFRSCDEGEAADERSAYAAMVGMHGSAADRSPAGRFLMILLTAVSATRCSRHFR
jgi:hypothetical protein